MHVHNAESEQYKYSTHVVQYDKIVVVSVTHITHYRELLFDNTLHTYNYTYSYHIPLSPGQVLPRNVVFDGGQ